MSADNWGICPECLRSGKLPVTDAEEVEFYDRTKGLVRTLREDYEQWMNEEGEYRLIYSCHCYVCNFKWNFNYKEQVLK